VISLVTIAIGMLLMMSQDVHFMEILGRTWTERRPKNHVAIAEMKLIRTLHIVQQFVMT